MHHSQCQSRIPTRSAIQLPDHSRHWKLLRLHLAGVLASQADRSSVTNRVTQAIRISSRHQEDNTHLLFCLMVRRFGAFSPHCLEIQRYKGVKSQRQNWDQNNGVVLSHNFKNSWNNAGLPQAKLSKRELSWFSYIVGVMQPYFMSL